MPTYISILRGINVSGHRMIKMDELKKMCAQLSFKNIHTYIQSGNLVFQSEMIDTGKISQSIAHNIQAKFGFDVPVITLTVARLEEILNENPFSNDLSKDPAFFHVTFLKDQPEKQNIELLNKVNLMNDSYYIHGNAIYLYCPHGYSNSKLTNSFIESKLKVTATTRNWKTIMAIYQIAIK